MVESNLDFNIELGAKQSPPASSVQGAEMENVQ